VSEAELEQLWTAKQTADYLDVSENGLARLRVNGKGPTFILVPGRSKIRYRPSAVAQWLESREAASMAAHHQADAKRAENAARQREGAAHAREKRWPKVVGESNAD
jgi:hypothetical protein